MNNNTYTANVQKYEQHGQEYLSTVLPFEIINKISKVLIYKEHLYGYQRKLNEKHYKAISKNILENKAILPTSIILSGDKSYLYSQLKEEDNCLLLSLDLSQQSLHIVDGQHRIKGLEEACKVDPSLNNFMFSVIILLTEPVNRVVEVNVFRDINSLGKKINTDLTLLAIYNYELLGEKKIENLSTHISVKAAHKLNENVSSVWYKAIQFNPNAESRQGIIGVSPFINSIDSIAKALIRNKGIDINCQDNEIIEQTEHRAEELAEFLALAWKYVMKKWPYCFSEKFNFIEDINEFKTIYYDGGYYIQKTTGTTAINMILAEIVSICGLTEGSLKSFSDTINQSRVTGDDWRVGGIFSGLTSSSGFKKAKNYIMNVQY